MSDADKEILRSFSVGESSGRPQTDLAERLRFAQKMEALGRLGTRVAHEVNNHLTLILGRMILLMEDAELSPQVREDLGDVLRVVEQIGELMREWLTLGKRDRPTAKEVRDLNGVIRGMIPMLSVALGRNLELVPRLGKEPALISVPRGQVEQVLLNLVLNARDAIEGPGTLTIATTHLAFGETSPGFPLSIPPGHYVVLSVQDTGSGMSPAVLEQIFEPFFTTKDPNKGTGMGLSTVLDLVKSWGGVLQVTSEPGQGSAFAIYLPRHGNETSNGETRVGAAPLSRRPMVMIVTNDDLLAPLLNEILAREGYSIVVSRASRDTVALCALHTGAIDLLIVDRDLSPEELDAVRRLQSLYPAAKVLHIGRSGEREEAGEFLVKPFTPAELLNQVRRILP